MRWPSVAMLLTGSLRRPARRPLRSRYTKLMNISFHQNRDISLSEFQKALVLSVFPEGARIVRSQYFDNFDLPCPVRVDVHLADGPTETVVLRSSRRGGVVREAALLTVLSRLGLPVPVVLAEPALDLFGESVCVLSMLSGINLQIFSMQFPDRLQECTQLVLCAISQLSDTTNSLLKEPMCQLIPRRTLLDQLDSIANVVSDWQGVPAFASASEILRPVLGAIRTPLVFTNGDYQPGNFLTDGHSVTGFVDFETACFQDPLIGFAKYPIYDLHPLNEAGLIGSMLAAYEFTQRDFKPRLALGCLMTLHKEIAVHSENLEDYLYKKHVLTLLDSSIH